MSQLSLCRVVPQHIVQNTSGYFEEPLSDSTHVGRVRRVELPNCLPVLEKFSTWLSSTFMALICRASVEPTIRSELFHFATDCIKSSQGVYKWGSTHLFDQFNMDSSTVQASE
jgi:hypothetical protein